MIGNLSILSPARTFVPIFQLNFEVSHPILGHFLGHSYQRPYCSVEDSSDLQAWLSEGNHLLQFGDLFGSFYFANNR